MKLQKLNFTLPILLIVLLFLFTETHGQDFCDSYRYKTELDFTRGTFRGGEPIMQIYLKKYLAECPSSEFFTKAVEDLKRVEELRADHNLTIAKFYWKKNKEGDINSLMGGKSRLLEITEKYPSFSKLDEVLYLLTDIALFEKNYSDAKRFYLRILNEFPFSEYVCRTNKVIIESGEIQ